MARPPDLGDELVKRAEHEQRTGCEQCGRDQGVAAPASAMEDERGGGEDLDQAEANDHRHENPQGADAGDGGGPRHGVFTAKAHQARHVHEPVILGNVGTREFLHGRNAPEPEVLETLGGEAVVDVVVVDIAQPAEVEAEHRPARPDQGE